MTDVALISELSHYKLKAQKDEYPDMPHFVAPDEIPMMLRRSQRKNVLCVHVLSLAVVADKEKHLLDFAALCKKRKADIYVERRLAWPYVESVANLVRNWKAARRVGAAKAGGDARSESAERDFWEGFSKIADRWHLKDTSKALMQEAGIKHHDTVRANLGYTRWEWRQLSDAKRDRVLKRKAKERSNYHDR